MYLRRATLRGTHLLVFRTEAMGLCRKEGNWLGIIRWQRVSSLEMYFQVLFALWFIKICPAISHISSAVNIKIRLRLHQTFWKQKIKFKILVFLLLTTKKKKTVLGWVYLFSPPSFLFVLVESDIISYSGCQSLDCQKFEEKRKQQSAT